MHPQSVSGGSWPSSVLQPSWPTLLKFAANISVSLANLATSVWRACHFLASDYPHSSHSHVCCYSGSARKPSSELWGKLRHAEGISVLISVLEVKKHNYLQPFPSFLTTNPQWTWTQFLADWAMTDLDEHHSPLDLGLILSQTGPEPAEVPHNSVGLSAGGPRSTEMWITAWQLGLWRFKLIEIKRDFTHFLVMDSEMRTNIYF